MDMELSHKHRQRYHHTTVHLHHVRRHQLLPTRLATHHPHTHLYYQYDMSPKTLKRTNDREVRRKPSTITRNETSTIRRGTNVHITPYGIIKHYTTKCSDHSDWSANPSYHGRRSRRKHCYLRRRREPTQLLRCLELPQQFDFSIFIVFWRSLAKDYECCRNVHGLSV